MKKIILIMTLLLVVAVSTTPVEAKEGDMYGGVKAGFMLIDVKSVDDILAFGGLFGMGIAPKVYVEAELNLGFIGGNFEPVPGVDGDFDIWTIGAYAVYKETLVEKIGTQKVYLKGKIGVLYENVRAKVDTFNESLSDVGLTFGGGAGIKLDDKTDIEVELTLLEGDVWFLSTGVNFAF
ncbi:MAG: outer membrane beta-barrel protein [Deltaproteobacteria bacterium]|nr:outer membrane beta-barrel protein [Deltaproteobacteria bacterium]